MGVIIVTGGNGQLATCLKDEIKKNNNIKNEYIFLTHKDFDITDNNSIDNVLEKYTPDAIINCAAYTNVERAEEDKHEAMSINGYLGSLAVKCQDKGIKIIHISTDYVFNGEKNTPYTENDTIIPINTYGISKALGETIISKYGGIVIRTSWLYSEFGKNFFKAMCNRIKDGETLRVVNDQIGTPTYGRDLARVILDIIENKDYKDKQGIYQYSNEGCCSWYDFAYMIELMIKDFKKGNYTPPQIQPCTTEEYPQKAKRPKYSVMSKEKFHREFSDKIKRHWVDALIECFKNHEENN